MATLESIFRRTTNLEILKLEDRRANISCSHLCFAADMLIAANTPHELQEILQELPDESENLPKTAAIMENVDTCICTNICQHHAVRESC